MAVGPFVSQVLVGVRRVMVFELLLGVLVLEKVGFGLFLLGFLAFRFLVILLGLTKVFSTSVIVSSTAGLFHRSSS